MGFECRPINRGLLVSGKVTITPWLTKPIVTTINPSNKAVNVPINQIIKIKFNKTIKTGNLHIELKTSSGKEVTCTKTISESTLILKPTTHLSKGTKYTIILHTGSVTDLAGNYIAPYSSSFTTI